MSKIFDIGDDLFFLEDKMTIKGNEFLFPCILTRNISLIPVKQLNLVAFIRWVPSLKIFCLM